MASEFALEDPPRSHHPPPYDVLEEYEARVLQVMREDFSGCAHMMRLHMDRIKERARQCEVGSWSVVHDLVEILLRECTSMTSLEPGPSRPAFCCWLQTAL